MVQNQNYVLPVFIRKRPIVQSFTRLGANPACPNECRVLRILFNHVNGFAGNKNIVISQTGGPNITLQSPSNPYDFIVCPNVTTTYTIVSVNPVPLNSSSCGATVVGQSITVNVEPNIVLSTPSVSDVSCNGGANGQVVVSSTGSLLGITYSIAPAGGTQGPIGTFNGLTAQPYIITASASGCSSVTTSVTVSQPAPLVIGTPSVTDVNCNGSATGQVTVSATGGQGTINYSILPNVGTQSPLGTFIGLTAQTYTFTATDANSCTSSTSVTVNPPAPVVMNTPSVTNVICNGDATGQVIASATGGVGAMTYSIVPNVGTQSPSGTFNGLTAQTYTITATSANACTASTSAIVTEPPKIVVTQFLPTSSTQCVGSTVAFNASATGVNMTVKWQKNGGNVTTPVPYTSGSTASYTTPALVASDNGAIYQAVYQDGCPNDEIATSIGTVTVNTPSVGGTLTPATGQGCGPTNFSFSVSGINGTVTQWERQTNCNGTWASIGSVGSTTKTLKTPNAPTCYRVAVTNGVCPIAYSNVSTITIDKPAIGGKVTLQSNQSATFVKLCTGQTAVLIALNYVGKIVSWQYTTNLSGTWNNIPSTANTQSLAVSAVPGNIFYRVFINTNLGICTGTASFAYSTTFKVSKMPGCSPDVSVDDTDMAKESGIKIMSAYPNPTSGFISLNIENHTEGAAQIDILDLMGRVVQRSKLNLDEGYNILSLDMSNLSSGLYLVRIKDRDKHEAVVRVSKL